MKLVLFYSYIFLLTVNFLDIGPIKAKYTKDKNIFEKEVSKNFSLKANQNKYLIATKRDNFKEAILGDFNNSNYKIAELIQDKKDTLSELNIISDIQYFEGDKFFASGNVVLSSTKLKLSGDKVIYDKEKKDFSIEGNVKLYYGSQYFEASKIVYNLNSGDGYIDNIYGVLDVQDFNNVILYDPNKLNSQVNKYLERPSLEDVRFKNTTTIGLVNTFERDRKFNITDVELDVADVNRWRFKSKKFVISNNVIKAKKVLLTNDAYNEPQFFIESYTFTANIFEDKLKIVSKNSWINLDKKVRLPIGKRTIVDKEPISPWGFGSDYTDKDGIYISRGLGKIDLFDDFSLKLTPYLLIQRSLKGNTDSFKGPNKSIISENVKGQEISFLDLFALDSEINGKINQWDLKFKSTFNSLDLSRFSEATRYKFTLTKSLILNKGYKEESPLEKDNFDKINYVNKIDFQFYSSYRERVPKAFNSEQSIYFAKGGRILNRKSWENMGNKSNLVLIYDLGEYEAKMRNHERLATLIRNVFAVTYDYQFPIWQKKDLDKAINSEYIYSPSVIKQGLDWYSSFNSAIFLYSNDSSQKTFKIGTGPKLTLGSLKNKFLDYTSISATSSYIFKSGESPFAFDDIDKTTLLDFDVEQQLYGPMIFSFKTSLNLDANHDDYGKFSKPFFGLDIKRRAYKIGAFYNSSSKSFGVQFKIFNFDYKGLNPSF